MYFKNIGEIQTNTRLYGFAQIQEEYGGNQGAQEEFYNWKVLAD